MAVTLKDVEHVAKLARLELTGAEKIKFTRHLNEILAYMEKLNEIDTAHVEPLSHVIDLRNVCREDVTRPSSPPEQMLKNAPDRKEQFFRVPKVIPGRASRKGGR
jgi:aspartyl-tRNA(Asn)/glutamyl-tRNA(Gln) amidotransferase subunit C